MSKIVFQLGNNAQLSRAEIDAVFGMSEKGIETKNFYEVSLPKQVVRKKFGALGGSVRAFEKKFEGETFGEVLNEIKKDIQKNATAGKKMRIGSFFFPKSIEKKFSDFAKKTKLFAKENEISLRIVNRGSQNLDSSAVLKEKILAEGNAEYGIIQQQKKWWLLKTLEIQSVEGFIERDMKKPVRDMQVGMMPPKMARMMINIARENGNLPEKIYDPFCGTGTVLLEAMDMDLKISGSDLSMKMVEATEKNTKWLFEKMNREELQSTREREKFYGEKGNKNPFFINDIFKKDAQSRFSPEDAKRIRGAIVVAEGYLGRIFQRPITEDQFWGQKDELFPMYRKFLFACNEAKIQKIVFGFPFWRGEDQKYSFSQKLCEFLEKLGYSSNHITSYMREGQVVGREIIVFQKTKKITEGSSEE
jgi:tRNA G10  N-methylase Trm11